MVLEKESPIKCWKTAETCFMWTDIMKCKLYLNHWCHGQSIESDINLVVLHIEKHILEKFKVYDHSVYISFRPSGSVYASSTTDNESSHRFVPIYCKNFMATKNI